MTEDQIERLIEQQIDALDARLMSNAITQARYDVEYKRIDMLSERLYRAAARRAIDDDPMGDMMGRNVIHHHDRDTLNDDVGNLRYLTKAEHIIEHQSDLRDARWPQPAAALGPD